MVKLKTLEEIVKDLNKIYGPGTIGRKSELPVHEINVIPSGCLAFDHASGIGGWPRGRFSVIYGAKSTWKTTFTLLAESITQKMDLPILHIEQENKYTDKYAIEQGIDIKDKKYYFSEPDSLEEALDIISQVLRSEDEIGLIVVDSVSMMMPQFLEGQGLVKGKDVDGKASGKNPTASQARALNIGIPRVNYWLRKLVKMDWPLPAIIFVQHSRLNPNAGMWEDPEYMPGGRQFEHSLTMQIRVKHGATEKEKEEVESLTKAGGRKRKVSETIHGIFEKNHASSESEGAVFEFDVFLKATSENKRGIDIVKDRKSVGMLCKGIRIKNGGFMIYRGEEEKSLFIKTENKLDEFLLEQDYFDLYNWWIVDLKGES